MYLTTIVSNYIKEIPKKSHTPKIHYINITVIKYLQLIFLIKDFNKSPIKAIIFEIQQHLNFLKKLNIQIVKNNSFHFFNKCA